MKNLLALCLFKAGIQFINFMGPLVAPLVMGGLSAVGSAVSNIFTNRANKRNAEKEREFQRQMAEYAHTKDLEMWNKANEYNAPSAQMQRLKDAGLNPALVYGSSGVSGNTTTQTPKYQKYDTPVQRFSPYEFPNLLNNLSAYQDFQIKKVQTDNLKEELESKKIQNSWLWDNLRVKIGKGWNDLKKGYLELYGDSEGRPKVFNDLDSPFLKRYQSQTQNYLLGNSLKKLDYNLKKLGGTWSDKALLRYMLLDGQVNNGQFKGLERYLLLDTIGTAAKYGAGAFGLKNLFNKKPNYKHLGGNVFYKRKN